MVNDLVEHGDHLGVLKRRKVSTGCRGAGRLFTDVRDKRVQGGVFMEGTGRQSHLEALLQRMRKLDGKHRVHAVLTQWPVHRQLGGTQAQVLFNERQDESL